MTEQTNKNNRIIVHKTTDHAGRDTQHVSLRKLTEVEQWQLFDDVEELFDLYEELQLKVFGVKSEDG